MLCSSSLIITHIAQQSKPVEVSTPLVPILTFLLRYHPTAPRKRRHVPITIVDDDTPQLAPLISPNAPRPTDTLLKPISSRALSPSTPPPPDGKPTPTAAPAAAAPPVPTPAPALAPVTQKPTPASFRDAKSVGRVGSGIFRMSGNDTVFKTREVPLPAVADPPPDPAQAPAPAPPPASVRASPTAPPLTHFEFTRAWDRIPPADTAARWALLNVRDVDHRLPFSDCADPWNSSCLIDDPPYRPPGGLRDLARTRLSRLAHPRASRRPRAARSHVARCCRGCHVRADAGAAVQDCSAVSQ